MEAPLRCLDMGSRTPCAGPVELRTTSDRTDGKTFPRCEAHYDRRERQAARNRELMSPTPASWFDASYAGERWDED